MSSVNLTAVLICPAVNGVSCFAYTGWLLHLLHSIKYMTLLVRHVVRCCSVIFSPVVLVTVCVKGPYVLQHAHLVSAPQGQNPELWYCVGLCCLCLCEKWIFRFLLVLKERPQILQMASHGFRMFLSIGSVEWSLESLGSLVLDGGSLLYTYNFSYNYGHKSWDTLLKWRPVSVIWKILLPRPPPPPVQCWS